MSQNWSGVRLVRKELLERAALSSQLPENLLSDFRRRHLPQGIEESDSRKRSIMDNFSKICDGYVREDLARIRKADQIRLLSHEEDNKRQIQIVALDELQLVLKLPLHVPSYSTTRTRVKLKGVLFLHLLFQAFFWLSN
eukprot:GHVP01038193.1.p1 GENE.GHVP01038193.1~~GHVP01038193.1.p1  ORF type:complete len:139 (-),score=16.71 GHVP01038193.1:422-838(-)